MSTYYYIHPGMMFILNINSSYSNVILLLYILSKSKTLYVTQLPYSRTTKHSVLLLRSKDWC
jgi:hypothetical protein